jgi:hypothetical protein
MTSSRRRKQLYRFAEADDCSDDTAGPTVDRAIGLEGGVMLARNPPGLVIPVADRSNR